MTDFADLWRFDLTTGHSDDPARGACLMDAISWFEYGVLDDHPACVCPVIAGFCRVANDLLPDAERQQLKAYIPRLVGTVDTQAEKARGEYLAWQAIRVFAPLGLTRAPSPKRQKALREATTLKDAGREAGFAAACMRYRTHQARVPFKVRNRNGSLVDEAEALRRMNAHLEGERTVAILMAICDSAASAAKAAKARKPANRAAWAGHAAWALAKVSGPALAAEVYGAVFAALDGVLAIGKQGEVPPHPKFRRAAETFAAARCMQAA